jgi:DNA-directed RNA polymerase subunit M/transcription elongation factor TFIIS
MSRKKIQTLVCAKCGQMIKDNGNTILICTSCGYSTDTEGQNVGGNRSNHYLNTREKSAPSGCIACGGPYPYCKTSCPIFDD